MDGISDIQKVQEEEYGFPNHYVPRYVGAFSTAIFYGFGLNYVSTIEFLIDRLKEMEFLSICDVGSGDGRFVKELAQHFPDRKVSGIDYSERAINLDASMSLSAKKRRRWRRS